MQIFKVGGAVRDRLLGRQARDVDWVVVGSTVEQMLHMGYQPVGTDFPIFLHPISGDEYALARTERKSVVLSGGLTVHASPEVTLEEDLARRDLTINAMAEDKHGVVFDPYGGQADLAARLLRHVAPSFAEDPLRVLRVARFAARYAPLGFTVAADTMDLMRQLTSAGELSAEKPERVWKEMSRALMEPRAEVFFEVLRECGALQVLMPELNALFGVVQPVAHHPEVDTGVHVMMALQQACRFGQPLSVRWAVLTHDFGKGLSPVASLPAHHGHEKAGVALVKKVNKRLKVPEAIGRLALTVCEFHTHTHRAFDLRPITVLSLLERLDAFRRPELLEQFVAACEMDARGRLGYEERDYPQAAILRHAATAARTVQADIFVARGLQGQAIGKAMRQARMRAVNKFQEEYKPPTQVVDPGARADPVPGR